MLSFLTKGKIKYYVGEERSIILGKNKAHFNLLCSQKLKKPNIAMLGFISL
jgi:hypothetical protein